MMNEVKSAVEREIYSLVSSGKGNTDCPRILRPLIGGGHRFQLPTDVIPWWFNRLPFVIDDIFDPREVQESIVTVSSDYFPRRKLPVFLDPINIFGVNPNVSVQVTSTLGKKLPTGVFYTLYLPQQGEGMHNLSVVPRRGTDTNIGNVQQNHLESMITYLKQLQPF